MIKEGYTERFSLATVASAGFLGIIIPPSIPMVIYSMALGISVTDVFLGGVIPGIMLACGMALYSIIYSAVCALVTDHVHLQNINMNVQIFTKDPELYHVILQKLGRGVTYWKAVGGYTETDTYVIITIISKYEIAPLRQMLLEKDPHAFVIMSEGPEILGNFEKRL